jgi:hypothetical protein
MGMNNPPSSLPSGTTWTSGAGVPTSGAAGTGAGTAEIGSIYSDTTNKVNYENIGTKASPSWAPLVLGDPI